MLYKKFGFTIDFDQDDEKSLDTSQFDNMTVEQFLGLVLHGQQQGVDKVYYRGYQVEVERMADTTGSPVVYNTQLRISLVMDYEQLTQLIDADGVYG